MKRLGTGRREYQLKHFDNGYALSCFKEYIKDPKEVIVWLENSPEAAAKLRNLASNAKWLFESCDFMMEDNKQLMEDINTYLFQNN